MNWPDDTLLRGYRSSATALLDTVFRVMVGEADGPIWTGTLIRALSVCGVKERNARQAIARVAERGNLQAEKIGARTRWHVTERGRALFASVRKRAADFRAVQSDWDGKWWVLICAMPELPRETRRLLRARLRFRGCGFINATTVLSTHLDREAMLLDIVRAFGLDGTAVVFEAKTSELLDDRDLLRRVWNTEDLADEHAAFIQDFEQQIATNDEAMFAAFVALEHKWIQLVATDPELPRALLPSPWVGERAQNLFEVRELEWAETARRWFHQIEADTD